MGESSSLSDFYGEPIFSYSRADAIADGVIVQVPADICKDAGIILPVCVTDHLWNDYIDPTTTHQLSNMPGQSVEGRLWDLLWMLHHAIKTQGAGTDRMRYTVLFLMGPNKKPDEVEVIAVCGPGDNREPVITIMLPGDD